MREVYQFQIKKPEITAPLPAFCGTAGGHRWGATVKYLTRDGQPYLYIMGEMHFSRVPAEDWKRELLKMKAEGISVVSSYVIWIHHEEEEGVFDFSENSNRDLRRFARICDEVGMPLFLRIGPWSHGEVRNGGFPDWLLAACKKADCPLRSAGEPYMTYVARFWRQIYEQVKEANGIVGIQIENEMTGAPAYLQTLCDLARQIGFHAPFWSATAWGNAQLPETLLPMFGGYPEAPWERHTHVLGPNPNSFFSRLRDDGAIGTDLLSHHADGGKTEKYDGRFPFLTCEIGGGNQTTYHRRPLITADDIASILVCKLGSGANGIGYYMAHGGINPIGKHSTMEERRAVGDFNDCPVRSYDFQAPIGDCGQLRQSYFTLQPYHRFIETFGSTLAAMELSLPDILPESPEDVATLRCAVRSDGESGFLFFNRYVRLQTVEVRQVQIRIHGIREETEIPLTVPSGAYGILPFGFKVGNIRFRYLTAMPVAVSDCEADLMPIRGVTPTVCLPDGTVLSLEKDTKIGNVTLRLLPLPEMPERKLQPLPVRKRTRNTLSFKDFAHLHSLEGAPLTDCSSEYEWDIPQNAETVIVRAKGNVGAAYIGDSLISDRFLDGDDWFLDVRGCGGKTAVLKIQPLTPHDRGTIYWESPMPEGTFLPEVFILL